MAETAIFGAGCFWSPQKYFDETQGVTNTWVGYAGGHTDNPTYEDVCSGSTNHAEVIKIEFDPEQTSFEKLLEVFWDIHDPTTKDRQGLDIGSQYRSAVFYMNDEQKAIAEKSKDEMNKSGKFANNIVTQIESYTNFYAAEDYHQKYYKKRMGLL